jgi:hypothetical protein
LPQLEGKRKDKFENDEICFKSGFAYLFQCNFWEPIQVDFDRLERLLEPNFAFVGAGRIQRVPTPRAAVAEEVGVIENQAWKRIQ